MKKRKEVRYDIVHMLRYEHLVAVQLNLVLVNGHPFLDLREIQHTRKIERIIHIEVYPEHRIIVHRIQFLIELEVVFILKF